MSLPSILQSNKYTTKAETISKACCHI